MPVDEVGVGGARDIEDVGRAHAHLAPHQTVGSRCSQAFPRYIVKEGSYRALVKIVVVALKFQVADNSIRALVAPIRQENDVVAVEGLRVAAPWLDDDRPVDTGLFLESGVAVV